MNIEVSLVDAAVLRFMLVKAPWTAAARPEQQRVRETIEAAIGERFREAKGALYDDGGFSLRPKAHDDMVTMAFSLADLRDMREWFASLKFYPREDHPTLVARGEALLLKLLPTWEQQAVGEDMLANLPPELRARLAAEALAQQEGKDDANGDR